jgi:hypothetical protein
MQCFLEFDPIKTQALGKTNGTKFVWSEFEQLLYS